MAYLLIDPLGDRQPSQEMAVRKQLKQYSSVSVDLLDGKRYIQLQIFLGCLIGMK